MLVCSCKVEFLVSVLLCDLALCIECSFNESWDEILVKGVVLSHPKIPVLGCD